MQKVTCKAHDKNISMICAHADCPCDLMCNQCKKLHVKCPGNFDQVYPIDGWRNATTPANSSTKRDSPSTVAV